MQFDGKGLVLVIRALIMFGLLYILLLCDFNITCFSLSVSLSIRLV